MPIQIVDNFDLSSAKPIDNRLVVGPGLFYPNRAAITNLYRGLRVWDFDNNTTTGLGFVWTGSDWISENTTAVSGNGIVGRIPYWNTTNTIISSGIQYNATNQNVGIATAPETGTGAARLVVSGNIKSTGVFVGSAWNGTTGITNIHATNIETGTMKIARLQGNSNSNWILTSDNANATSYKNPSTINVGSANRLSATYSIFGQNFNGTQNVTGSGTFTDVLFGANILNSKATLRYSGNSNRLLTVPSNLGGDRTFAFIDHAQTFSANNTFSGANILKVADGSVSSPSIAFSSDINTGIYRLTSGVFSLVSGGLNKIIIGSTGYTRGSADIDLRNGFQNTNYTTESLSYVQGKNLIEAGEFVQQNYTLATGVTASIFQYWMRIGKTVFVSFQISPISSTITNAHTFLRPISATSNIIGFYRQELSNNGGVLTTGGPSGAFWRISSSTSESIRGFYSYLL